MVGDNMRKRGTAGERERILEAIPFHEENAISAVEIARLTGLPMRKVGGIIRWNLVGRYVARKKDETSKRSNPPWLYWKRNP